MCSLSSIGFLLVYTVSFIAAHNRHVVTHHEDNPISEYDVESWSGAELNRWSIGLMSKSANSFGIKCFKQIVSGNTGNLIFSPVSTLTTVLMMTFGANVETRKDMHNVIELKSHPFLAMVGSQSFVNKLAEYEEFHAGVRNTVYLSKSISPKPDFVEIVHNTFHSEIQYIYMTTPLLTSWNVNSWFDTKTDGHIKAIVEPKTFGPEHNLLLLDAVYFKGTWLKQFNPKWTIVDNFYVNAYDKIDVPIMSVSGKFRNGLLSTFDSRFIELPYKSVDGHHNVSMFIILPNKRNGLADLEANLASLKVEHFVRRGRVDSIDLYLPKFKIEKKIELNEPLSQMGMRRAFERASFSDIVVEREITIDKFIQKVVVEVNEMGSAATGAPEIDYRYHSATRIFNVDHPFLAFIATTDENPLVLFTLRYTGRE